MRLRRAATAWAIALGLCAQQSEPPVFRTTARLVEFTVVATDAKGRAVTDLRSEDLEVFDKGERRAVAFFRHEGTEDRRRAQPLTEGTFSNRVEFAPGPARNITALVVDTLNTPPEQTLWVRAQLARQLRVLAPETRVAVFHLGAKLEVLHDFTDDFEALRERVRKAVLGMPLQAVSSMGALIEDAEKLLQMFPGDPALESMLKNQIEIEGLHNAGVRQRRLEQTLNALEALGAHLGGIPGRKNLVWIGGGISMLAVTGAMGFGPHGGARSYENVVEGTARRLAQQGIAMYMVDAAALAVPRDVAADTSRPMGARGGRDPFEAQRQSEQLSADPLPAALKMAEITGGRVIRNTNDMLEGLRRAAEDVRGSYTVAFYATGEADGRWHGLKVRARRAGVRLSYRQGYVAEERMRRAEWGQEDWRAAATNPLASGSIGIDALCRKYEKGGPGAVALLLQFEPSHLSYREEGAEMVAEVEIGLAEKTAAGIVRLHREAGRFTVPAGATRRPAASETRYLRTWTPAEGVTAVRVVVRDRTGNRYGTLDVALPPVPALPKER